MNGEQKAFIIFFLGIALAAGVAVCIVACAVERTNQTRIEACKSAKDVAACIVAVK